VQYESLKHRFLDLAQVAFWAGQEAENETAVPREQLKHCFLNLTRVAFWAGQGAKNVFKVP